jgi:hypothetical protein
MHRDPLSGVEIVAICFVDYYNSYSFIYCVDVEQFSISCPRASAIPCHSRKRSKGFLAECEAGAQYRP